MGTIQQFNLWGLIDFWAATVKKGADEKLSFASFSLLLLCSKKVLMAAQNMYQLIPEYHKSTKVNDLDFGAYLMGFPHGLRKTNPTVECIQINTITLKLVMINVVFCHRALIGHNKKKMVYHSKQKCVSKQINMHV